MADANVVNSDTNKDAVTNDCPICYTEMGNTDVCVTICNHKFHTGCIVRCNNICPICRNNLITNTNTNTNNRIPQGTYNMQQFLQQMELNNVTYESLSPNVREWLEECKEHEDSLRELNTRVVSRQEKFKDTLKRTNPDKYRLMFG